MYIESLRSLSSAHEKWGQKQKCCVYNFDQCIYIYIYTILPKVLGHPLPMNRFDYFSNFHEYKS